MPRVSDSVALANALRGTGIAPEINQKVAEALTPFVGPENPPVNAALQGLSYMTGPENPPVHALMQGLEKAQPAMDLMQLGAMPMVIKGAAFHNKIAEALRSAPANEALPPATVSRIPANPYSPNYMVRLIDGELPTGKVPGPNEQALWSAHNERMSKSDLFGGEGGILDRMKKVIHEERVKEAQQLLPANEPMRPKIPIPTTPANEMMPSWEGWPWSKYEGEAPRPKDMPPSFTPEGNWRLYHGTTRENAESIMREMNLRPDDIGAVGVGTRPQDVSIYGLIRGRKDPVTLELEIERALADKLRATHEVGGSGSGQFLLNPEDGTIRGWKGVPVKRAKIIREKGDYLPGEEPVR